MTGTATVLVQPKEEGATLVEASPLTPTEGEVGIELSKEEVNISTLEVVNVGRYLSVVQINQNGSVILDRPSMAVGYPYHFWLDEEIFLIAIKHEDGTVEFFSVPPHE